MARPDQEAIETFISITGVSEATARQRLEEHGGSLNEAINAHFSEGDRHTINETSVAAPQDDVMDIDDPIEVGSHIPPFSLLSSSRNLNPFSLLDPNFGKSIFDSGTGFTDRAPLVSHPREVREIPIEVKDETGQSSNSGRAPAIEDVTETACDHGPEIHGTVTIDDDDDECVPASPTSRGARRDEQNDEVLGSYDMHHRPSAPGINALTDYSNDIEEEMIQAAIEASKQDSEIGYSNQQFGIHNEISDPMPQQRQSHLEDAELAHAVSLSLKTAEQEKTLRELGTKVGPSEEDAYKSVELEDLGKSTSTNGRLEAGSSSAQDDTEDVEEQPLVRHRIRRMSSGSVETAKEIGEVEVSSPSSPQQHNNVDSQHSGTDIHDAWGGISSEEHDEAVMLEAALFGGIPEGSGYHFPYAPHQLMQNGLGRTVGGYPQRRPRPPSPSLAAQRLIREQQDDEYLASLQADREKDLKAMQEAEAALEEERRKHEESRKQLEEEQEMERQLVAKEASLPEEPSVDDENAVTLLVRMPDGSRRGRRFLKSDKLQYLFDFIDVGRGVKPGTYRLVRPYPRQAFNDGESAITLNELGLTSKQEALFLELI